VPRHGSVNGCRVESRKERVKNVWPGIKGSSTPTECAFSAGSVLIGGQCGRRREQWESVMADLSAAGIIAALAVILLVVAWRLEKL
jgi:hypothetical protein